MPQGVANKKVSKTIIEKVASLTSKDLICLKSNTQKL